jgi:hypothetical protein
MGPPASPRPDNPRRRRAPLAAYANYFEVGHNAFEFLIDFGQYQPEADAVTMHSRMATGPVHAKLLAGLLSDAVARFEAEHGPIADFTEAAAPGFVPLLIPPPDFEQRAALARAEALLNPPPER